MEQHQQPPEGGEGEPHALHQQLKAGALGAEAVDAHRDDVERSPYPHPQIYVASLADYNAGRLHGVWLDAAQDVEELGALVQDMLDRSQEPGAEEYAVHDYDGFQGLAISEHEGLEQVSHLAKAVAQRGPAFAAWANWSGERGEDAVQRFEDAYHGHYDSTLAYGQEVLEIFGWESAFDELPELIRPYVTMDLASLVRDMAQDGMIYLHERPDGSVFVFWTD